MKNKYVEISRTFRNLRYHCSEMMDDFKISLLNYEDITKISATIVHPIDFFVIISPINEKVKNNIKKQIRNEK